jgi:hypothetical protein
MAQLRDQQARFASSLRDPDNGQAMLDLAAIGAQSLPQRARLDVYRNNVTASLIDALAELYPVCRRLVGDDFFTAAAQAYLSRSYPERASLIGFAPDFAGFLVGFEPARGLPYLPDVARLEHAWHRVYHAADAVPATAADLKEYEEAYGERALDRLQLGLVPAHQLLMSPYPVSRIWETNQPDRDGQLILSKDARSERVLVVRPAAQVEVRRVSSGGFAFLCAVQGGVSLGRALIAAFEEEPDCDPQKIFAELLVGGSFLLPDMSGDVTTGEERDV